ncbi:MAG TPA: nuclear transport factor 2 family protein [Steroidobacteraceae bacterium]|nr:nuclear transport factor 2 family protein [Steroidobacteraceae bacterium]
MKRLALVLFLFLPALATGEAPAAAGAPAAKELTALLEWFLAGASRNDAGVHERFWANELIYTSSAGERTDKAEILASLRAEPETPAGPPTTYSAEDIRIRQYGDTAVVAFRLVGRTAGDTPATQYYLNTGTFLRRSGEWRAIAWQATHEAPPAPAKDAEVNLTPGAVARPGLAEEIRAADAEFFRAFFDTCDVETVRRYVTDDFEMFHDKSGRVITSGAAFVQDTVDKCRRQAEGTDFLSTRKLVPESLEVYPIAHYGAVETGVHRFYAVKQGEPDRLTETGKFTIVWKDEDGQWRVARALSYDHVLAP